MASMTHIPPGWHYDVELDSYCGEVVDERGIKRLVSVSDVAIQDYGAKRAFEMAKSKYISTYDPKHKEVVGRYASGWTEAYKPKAVVDYAPASSPIPTYVPANPFMDKVLEMEPVGSRVTCNPAPTDTDEDFLILTDKLYRLVEDCKSQGFKGGGVYFTSEGKVASNFISIRNGNINLIVTEDKEFYDKFLLATHVCKTLNILDKPNRIMVFQGILYGNKKRGIQK
jgi:hypothetical protein